MRLPLDSGEQVAIDAVLFDMDGTLVDSLAATERIWRQWAVDHGVADRLVIAHGQPADATVAGMLPHLTGPELEAVLADQLDREIRDLDGVRAMPGALALVDWLTTVGVPWAVVTSADEPLARARLGAAGIASSVLVSRRDVGHGKPHPEPYLLGAARVGVDPGRCLVVEDTAAGVASGRAAGCVTAGLGDVGAHVRIDDMQHLHTLLGGSRA